MQATDGSFYGTTSAGGVHGYGTVFKITPAGRLTSLHSFESATNGANPNAGLVQATDGNFYGTTSGGGVNGHGTVFKITTSGRLTTLHSFDSTDGAAPIAGLVQATDGNFYGTTSEGGINGYGTVFKLNPARRLTTLHNFDLTDGATRIAGLVQATDGNFYGTTYEGGAQAQHNNCVSIQFSNGCGTIFKITPGEG